MFCLNYSASWYENLSKIPSHLFLRYLSFEDGLRKDFMFLRGVIAGNFSVGMNSLPFLQGGEEDSGGDRGHGGRHAFFLGDGKGCRIRVKGVGSAEGTRSCLVRTCHTLGVATV